MISTDNYIDIIKAIYTNSIDGWNYIESTGIIFDSEDVIRPTRIKIQVLTGYKALFDKIIVEEL